MFYRSANTPDVIFEPHRSSSDSGSRWRSNHKLGADWLRERHTAIHNDRLTRDI